MAKSEALLVRFGASRIKGRQIDELIGLAAGLCADDVINEAEAEFLQSWLAANAGVVEQPVVNRLLKRINSMLRDGVIDQSERDELLRELRSVSPPIELGEALRATECVLCTPAPNVTFQGRAFCFTGKFSFGTRSACETSVIQRGGSAGNLTSATHFLVVGGYACDSWKHSNMGNKIIEATKFRDRGLPISIISEEHWKKFL